MKEEKVKTKKITEGDYTIEVIEEKTTGAPMKKAVVKKGEEIISQTKLV